MKNQLYILILTITIGQNVMAQCDSISAESVANYTALTIDSLEESDGLRDGPDYNGATLYYPDNGDSNLRCMVLVPGFQATQQSVIPWARYLATRGFASMTIGTNRLGDDPSTRARALIDGMETMRAENERISSPLYQRIDTGTIAVGGWSMGGGGAQLAAKIEPRIKAILAITPWLGRDVSLPSDLEHDSPVLILSGRFDFVAPPAAHANVHYDNTPNTTSKLLFELTSGNHNTALNPMTGDGEIGNIAYAWLNLFLDDNDCYCEMLEVDSLDQNGTASMYETNLKCLSVSTQYTKPSNLNLQVAPNPFADQFAVHFSQGETTSYMIMNVFGQVVLDGVVRAGDRIDLSKFTAGTYLLKVESQVIRVVKN